MQFHQKFTKRDSTKQLLFTLPTSARFNSTLEHQSYDIHRVTAKKWEYSIVSKQHRDNCHRALTSWSVVSFDGGSRQSPVSTGLIGDVRVKVNGKAARNERKKHEKRDERQRRRHERSSCAQLSWNIAEQRLWGCFYRRLHCAPATRQTAQRLWLVAVRRGPAISAATRRVPPLVGRPRYFLAVFEELRPPARTSHRVATTRLWFTILATAVRRRIHALRIYTGSVLPVRAFLPFEFLSWRWLGCRALAIFQASYTRVGLGYWRGICRKFWPIYWNLFRRFRTWNRIDFDEDWWEPFICVIRSKHGTVRGCLLRDFVKSTGIYRRFIGEYMTHNDKFWR